VREHPTVTEYQRDLAGSLDDVGVLQSETGHAAEALDWFRRALAIREQLAREHPTVTNYQSDLADSLNNIGTLLKDMGHAAKALESYRVALAIRERLVRENPTVTKYQSDLAGGLYSVACVRAIQARATTDPAEAKKHADDAMAALRRAVAAGWSDWKHASGNEDLNALRGRADFQELLRDRLKSTPAEGKSQ
jgi:tetratricopeptide (TPR) repeat protein